MNNMKTVCKQEYEINPLTGRCVKKCKEGFERNPVTGRCKKIPVLKFCKEGFEKNPLTGRCIKTCKIDSERNPKTKRCIKKCKEGFERNTVTGRCKKIPVSKNTISPTVECKKNIYTGICREFISPPYVKLPFGNADSLVDEMFCGIDDEVLEDVFDQDEYDDDDMFSQEFIDDIKNNTTDEKKCEIITKRFPKKFVNKITGLFGMGSFGFVFANTEPNGERIAVKVSSINEHTTEDDLNAEVRISKIFFDLGVGLEIKKFGTAHIENSGRDLHGFIQMERINGTLWDLLKAKEWNKSEIHEIVSKIFDIIKIISDNNLFHGDLHLQNIGFITDSYGELQLKLIDFGRSHERSAPRGDIALLLRSAYSILNPFIRDTFVGFTNELLEKMFNVRLKIHSTSGGEREMMLFFYAMEKFGLD